MARLWTVSKPGIDMPLLMKVPILGEGGDPAAIVSFEMEQMIMARISGPHVPKFVAAGDFAVHPYIVMERLAGKSLLPRLRDLPLPYEEVAEIGWKVATALEDLHRQHVIHLDIKPSNILFRPTGEAVLIDFGLSRHTQLPDLMQEEFRLPYGTAPYMAPEQLLGIRHDPRSDQFGLGVLLYFFSTGERPFGESERLSVMKKRLWRDPSRRGPCGQIIRHGCKRSCCAASKWSALALFHGGATCFELSNHQPDQADSQVQAALKPESFLTVMKRRFNPDLKKDWTPRTVATPLPAAPIIAIALHLSEEAKATNEALREAAGHALKSCREPGSLA